eukprot:8617970-Alexandrium_andersonii.AAC.1
MQVPWRAVRTGGGRGGVLAPEQAPDALRVVPPRADIGSIDDVPAAGTVGLAEQADVVRVHIERLVLHEPFN